MISISGSLPTIAFFEHEFEKRPVLAVSNPRGYISNQNIWIDRNKGSKTNLGLDPLDRKMDPELLEDRGMWIALCRMNTELSWMSFACPYMLFGAFRDAASRV